MYTKVKGTNDILPVDARKLFSLEYYLRQVVSLYGYEEIRVPILTQSELIHRSSGEGSDIVTKETFDFKDRGDRLITLRPEGTAPVIRAVIENKLYTGQLPLKLFYVGDMFRYERPQKGRYREFSQFGVEVIGSYSPYVDAEVITLASTIFRSLRIKNYRIRLNTLGDNESRAKYQEVLKEYFKDKLDSLCDDCKKRFENNPLRILDCKVDKDSDALKNAPKISDCLSDKSKAEFEVVKAYLTQLDIPFVVDEKLVRGLDYYTNTIFEVELVDGTNVQTICAGGRYNNLMKLLDGPDLGCVGFAFGLERLIDAIPENDTDYSKKVICQLIPIGIDAKAHMIGLLDNLRVAGFTAEMSYDALNLKAHFKAAESNKARFIIIIGDDELKDGKVKIKNKMKDTEETISEKELTDYMMKNLRCKGNCETCEGENCEK